MTSSAGDATLSVADPSATATGRLVNGSVRAHAAAAGARHQRREPRSRRSRRSAAAHPLTLLTYTAPISLDQVTIGLRQAILANEPLRTGLYSKTLTFTLSTTTP